MRIPPPLNSLTNNKASAGIDEISAELLKHVKDVITEQLVVLLNSIWRDVEVPDAWKKGIIVKKGNLSDCNKKERSQPVINAW